MPSNWQQYCSLPVSQDQFGFYNKTSKATPGSFQPENLYYSPSDLPIP